MQTWEPLLAHKLANTWFGSVEVGVLNFKHENEARRPGDSKTFLTLFIFVFMFEF